MFTRILLSAALGIGLLSWNSPLTAKDQPEDVKKLLDQVVKAHGGKENLTKYKAAVFDVKGEMALLGQDMEFVGNVKSMIPGKFRMEMNADILGMKLSIIQLINGDKGTVIVNGMEQEVPEDQATEMRQGALSQELSSFLPLYDADKYTVAIQPEVKVGDAQATVISISSKEMKTLKMFFDKETFLLIKTERDGISPDGSGKVLEESMVSDYKDINGIQTAMSIKVLHDGKKFMSMKLTNVELLEKLEDKNFANDK